MWWYGYGWWWWVAFVVIFFLIPLGYGWGYRGWGPWYRRRRASGTGGEPPGTAPGNMRPNAGPPDEDLDYGWGWGGTFLWFIFIIAILWLIAAWGWGGMWRGY